MKKIFTQLSTLLLLMLPALTKAQSAGNPIQQRDPLIAQYFENRFLGNPALAGADTGLNINVGYRKQWKDMPDAPVTFALTGDYQVAKKLGVGLTVFNDQAGILKQTRVALSYAYHMPLNENNTEFLHVGMTAALDNRRVERKKIIGDPNDPAVDEFNRRDNYFESDLGVAYTNQHLTIQASLPNLVSTFQNKDKVEPRNTSTFMVAASYKFGTKSFQVSSVEPMIAFRGVKGYKGILDVGTKVSLAKNFVNLFALYHTSNAVTAGVGFQFKNSIEVQASYTSQTAGVKNNIDGNFGLGIKIRLFR
ncbi:PorP/SprF family type IX secretion system membrane protein [Chitinophaga sp. 22620]|jgi:type IX secretion system PorP/SprF family membrane protein|uniref:PorP/SprF family type IX secretion system membrane protein n=1 Tax=Chitinophaga sp. 22620 TaxID=3453952 RepID=UPI003F82AE84